MVKFYEGCFKFNFQWDQVAQAFWCRYPNPYSNHVLSEDVVWREVRDDGNLYSKRLLTKTNRVPEWGKRFFNARAICIVEESVVDRNNKTIVTYTRNIGFSKVMTVDEKCIYRHVEGNRTTVERKAWIASSVFGFSRAIEAFSLDRFRKNSVKAVRGYEHVMEVMFGEGTEKMVEHTSVVPLLDKTKLKETAKKATELAKSKASPLVAAATRASNKQNN